MTPPQGILNLNVDLGTIEGSVSRIQLPGMTKLVQGLLELRFGVIPANTNHYLEEEEDKKVMKRCSENKDKHMNQEKQHMIKERTENHSHHETKR